MIFLMYEAFLHCCPLILQCKTKRLTTMGTMTMNICNTVAMSDQLLMTVSINGAAKLNCSGTGFSSLDDVLAYVRERIGSFVGLARVTVRNKTQGWSRMLSLSRHSQACYARRA